MKLVPPANINTITSKHQHNFHSHIMKFFDARFTIPLSHQGSLLKLIAYQSCFLSELQLQSEDFKQRKDLSLDGGQLKLHKPFCHCILRTSPNNSHPKLNFQNSEGKTAVFRHIHLGHSIIFILVSLPIWMKFLDILPTYTIPSTQQINHLLSLVVTSVKPSSQQYSIGCVPLSSSCQCWL